MCRRCGSASAPISLRPRATATTRVPSSTMAGRSRILLTAVSCLPRTARPWRWSFVSKVRAERTDRMDNRRIELLDRSESRAQGIAGSAATSLVREKVVDAPEFAQLIAGARRDCKGKDKVGKTILHE